MKKYFAILMTLALMFSLAVPAMAGDATVTNATNHGYNVYQIFSGSQATGEIALGDIDWGQGIQSDGFLDALQATTGDEISAFLVVKEIDGTETTVNIFTECVDAADVAEVLSNYQDKHDVVKAFANIAAKHLGTMATTISAGATTTELASGYYLLVDAGAVLEHDAYNPALLQVTNKGKITIEQKYTVPTVDKNIGGDPNVNAGDYNIGDSVSFTLVGTLPNNLSDYDTYKYVFHDTLSSGLAFNNDVKVYVVTGTIETEIASGFTVDVNDTSLTISSSDILTLKDKEDKEITLESTSTIVVQYTATVHASAKIGYEGNPNKVYLEYSNNPNWNGSGDKEPTGTTPEDKVLVFTYELDVTKTDGTNTSKRLDADFVLYRKVTKLNDNGQPVTENEYVEIANDGKVTNWTTIKPEPGNLKTGADGLVQIIGLDAGTYWLEETKAPSGYNKLTDPIELEIKATLNTSDDQAALEHLEITVGGNTTDGEKTTDQKFTGVVGTTVENNAGSTLPETGGMGTTIFYIVGGVMVVAAVVLLITKKRMGTEG